MAPRKTLYSGETKKAVDNFPISGETVPDSVIHWLGRIKGAAARANADLGKLDGKLANAIVGAAEQVAAGDHDNQFPIDVFQTGSGTSTNTNANEVIAALAGEGAHPNDHVNMGQSSNDVFPSAVHLAALDRATNQLLPALKQLERSLARKAKRWPSGPRTELLDLYPRLDFPVLLLWADSDRRHPLQAAEEALDLLPDGQLRVLSASGFLIAYDDPVGVARELAAFCG